MKITYRKETKTGIEYVGLSHLPMADWDWPDKGHKVDACVTIRGISDVLKELGRFLRKYPNQSIRVYQTPGGIRTFFVGEPLSVGEFHKKLGFELGTHLNQDPMYRELVLRRNEFTFRISPKPRRKGDYVAKYLYTLNSRNADKELVKLLEKVHDLPISKYQ